MSRLEIMAFDLELAIGRNDDHEGLGRRDDATDGVDGKLLDHAIHRGGELLQAGTLLGLDDVLKKPPRLLLRLGKLVQQAALILGDGSCCASGRGWRLRPRFRPACSAERAPPGVAP